MPNPIINTITIKDITYDIGGSSIVEGQGIKVSGNTVSLNDTFYNYLVQQTFAAPALTLTISGFSGTHEIGTPITVSQISHKETNINNIDASTLKLYRGNNEIQSITPSSSSIVVNLDEAIIEQGQSAGSITYKLQCKDILNNNRSASVTGTWERYVYSQIGNAGTVPTTAAQCVKQSNINTFANNGADFTYTVGSCLWLLTTKANAKIQTNVLGQWADVTTYSSGSIEFTQANGVVATYYAYHTDTFTGAGTAKYRVA